MFRELTRKNKELSMEECVRVLKSEKRGVLSVLGDNGYPYGMPMNHWYDENDGKLYFHCGRAGHRLDSLKKHNKVSFCTYDRGYSREGEWALNIKSVIVFGTVKIIDNADKIKDITTKLSHKFTSDEEYIQSEIEMHLKGTLLLQLIPEHICGKSVQES
ncbi:MAG: pyridoxamine 5'-phosphate oxidase family protein [Clostridia bacterium]|nr:pyridoxamine 5'-phosphate oxidase family protein [Clostridia bacterium]